MATNRDPQGSRTGTGQGGSQGTVTRSSRGFAAMDQEKQREIARKGGAASARSQTRDEQGQFGGSRSQSGTNAGAAGSRQDGMNQGMGQGMGQGAGRGSSRPSGQSGNRSGQGGANR